MKRYVFAALGTIGALAVCLGGWVFWHRAYDLCIPVTLWANRIREDQVGVNGHFFDRGVQVNFRPITVDTSAGENVMVHMVMADVVPSWYEGERSAVFTFSLKDHGDWNLIDAESFSVENGEGVRVHTEYASGPVTMVDGCSENAKALATYTLW